MITSHQNAPKTPGKINKKINNFHFQLEMMSTSIDPCNDFHQHVCDGYDPKKRKLERLLKLIDTSDKPDHDKAMRVVRRMLSKCAVERKEFEEGWQG